MIRLEDASRLYQVGDQEVRALQEVDLEVAAGEYVAIMGPSGSGKSTLLNLLGLLDTPSAGRYYLFDREVSSLSEREQAEVRRSRVGFVFQFFHLVPRLSALENVALPLSLCGVGAAERRRRARATLESFGLGDRLDHRPDQLSGGQRQRVAIARATVLEPAMILADEPTGNLDRAAGAEVLRILESLNQRGIAILVVTHDAEVAQRARRRLRMLDGRIAEDSGRARP